MAQPWVRCQLRPCAHRPHNYPVVTDTMTDASLQKRGSKVPTFRVLSIWRRAFLGQDAESLFLSTCSTQSQLELPGAYGRVHSFGDIMEEHDSGSSVCRRAETMSQILQS